MGQVPSIEGISEPCYVEIPNQGQLKGVTIKEPTSGKPLTKRFTKVRYGQPPVGDWRFRRARPLPADYDFTGDYTEFGVQGAQPVIRSEGLGNVSTKVATQEDITYLNIWIPASDEYKPAEGWPVLIFLHGGFLQYGKPNHTVNFDPRDLQNDEYFKQHYIIVAPGYRVSMFGFMTSKELLEEDKDNVNVGFWDQRLALEWTYKYIKYFGGNPEQITCSGRSAGSYSTFFQMCYEMYHPEVTQIIKQVGMISNALAVQPKGLDEVQLQFNEVLDKLGIDKDLSSPEKLSQLRKVPHNVLEDMIPDMQYHTFRAVTDGNFISDKILQEIENGEFAKKFVAKGLRLVTGEVSNEYLLYSMLNTPLTYDELIVQLNNYYPKKVIDKLLEIYPTIDRSLETTNPEEFKAQLKHVFGSIVCDLQVTASTRGFLHRLHKHGVPLDRIYRYRVNYRPQLVDKYVDPKDGVPHACENQIWFYSKLDGFTPDEEKVIQNWLSPFVEFYCFEDKYNEWGTTKLDQYRFIDSDGSVSVVDDEFWDWGLKVSDAVYKAELEN